MMDFELDVLLAYKKMVLEGKEKGNLDEINKEIAKLRRRKFILFAWAFTPGWIALVYILYHIFNS